MSALLHGEICYLYDHLAGDKEVGGGGKRPEEGSHHEEKNNAENTTSDRFEIKSVNGIKCFCCGNLCQSICNSKCMGMCVHMHLCPHGDFVLPLLLSTCPPLMPSLLHLGCRSMSLANPGGCDICHANDTHTHTHKQIKINNTDRKQFTSYRKRGVCCPALDLIKNVSSCDRLL